MAEMQEINRVTDSVIGAAIEVHRVLGPGLLESAYQACLLFELIEGVTRSKRRSGFR